MARMACYGDMMKPVPACQKIALELNGINICMYEYTMHGSIRQYNQ